MAGANMAFVFGSIVAGAVVIDYGIKSIKQGFQQVASVQSGSGGSSTSTPGQTSGPAEKQIAAAGRALGLNKNAIAGIIGNGVQETGGLNNGSPDATANVTGCRGFLCWDPQTNPNASKVRLGDFAQQVALAIRELPGGVAAFNAAATSPQAAAVYFEQHFEHAGTPNMAARIAAAQAAAAAGY